MSVHYDPMIAKLVVWSSDRSSALRKLRSCLSEYNIVGLNTNVDFLMQLSAHPKFVEGDVHTSFIDQHHDELFPGGKLSDVIVTQAVLASVLSELRSSQHQQAKTNDPFSPFSAYPMARLNHSYQRSVKLTNQSTVHEVAVTSTENGKFLVKVGGSDELQVSARLFKEDDTDFIEVIANGDILKSRVVILDGNVHLFTKVSANNFQFRIFSNCD